MLVSLVVALVIMTDLPHTTASLPDLLPVVSPPSSEDKVTHEQLTKSVWGNELTNAVGKAVITGVVAKEPSQTVSLESAVGVAKCMADCDSHHHCLHWCLPDMPRVPSYILHDLMDKDQDLLPPSLPLSSSSSSVDSLSDDEKSRWTRWRDRFTSAVGTAVIAGVLAKDDEPDPSAVTGKSHWTNTDDILEYPRLGSAVILFGEEDVFSGDDKSRRWVTYPREGARVPTVVVRRVIDKDQIEDLSLPEMDSEDDEKSHWTDIRDGFTDALGGAVMGHLFGKEGVFSKDEKSHWTDFRDDFTDALGDAVIHGMFDKNTLPLSVSSSVMRSLSEDEKSRWTRWRDRFTRAAGRSAIRHIFGKATMEDGDKSHWTDLRDDFTDALGDTVIEDLFGKEELEFNLSPSAEETEKSHWTRWRNRFTNALGSAVIIGVLAKEDALVESSRRAESDSDKHFQRPSGGGETIVWKDSGLRLANLCLAGAILVAAVVVVVLRRRGATGSSVRSEPSGNGYEDFVDEDETLEGDASV